MAVKIATGIKMNSTADTTHLGALLQMVEKVARELDWSCVSIEIDVKLKNCSDQHWSEVTFALLKHTFLKLFAISKYKLHFKSLWLINRELESQPFKIMTFT